MKNFVQRTLTGIVIVATILAAIYCGPYSFITLFSILTMGILWEFYTLVNISKEVHINRVIHCAAGISLMVMFFLCSSHLCESSIFLIYIVYMMIKFINMLYTKCGHPIRELAYVVLGQIHIAMPIALLGVIAYHTNSQVLGTVSDYSPLYLISMFLFIWINDTGAYLTGMTFGKHKLFPRVSPKKTWEGFYGGLIFCMLLGLLLSYDAVWTTFGIDVHDDIRLSKLQWVGMGAVVSIFSTYGDLIESFVKRSVGVKDSGSILPGHGGWWDRFDSLLMASPAVLIYLYIMKFI